jgi:ABC-2 type transport system permease protein
MSLTATLATAARVLLQMRRDKRTLALMMLVPCVLLSLLAWIYVNTPVFDHIGAPLLGVFPFVVMFLVTSVATLRERTTGTLERLMTLPVGKLDLLLGYGIAFGVLAVIQACLASGLAVLVLGLDVAGPAWLLVICAVLVAILGTALGLLVSAFASTEFQAVQFMPAIVLPQILLCGLFVAQSEMATWLRAISYALPLTYAYDALARTAADNFDARFVLNVAVVCGCVVLAIVLGGATLRRRTG